VILATAILGTSTGSNFALSASPNLQTASTPIWSITPGQTFMWSGKPYFPIGLHSDGSISQISNDIKLGCHDFCIDLPASGTTWSAPLDLLTKSDCHYFISINSSAPNGFGYPIDPIGYRIVNITQNQHIHLVLPDCTQALTVLATVRDGNVEKSQVEKTPGGILDMDVSPENDLDHVLLIYPLTRTLEIPDYWEGSDSQRDSLLHDLASIKDKSGLRGIINPLGRTPTIPQPGLNFVPSSEGFHDEFTAYLRDKYKDINALFSTWGIMAPDLHTFAEVSRLVPLWVGERGVKDLYDPSSGHLYQTDTANSLVWSDIQTVLNQAGQRRFKRLVAAIHGVVDVPVFQDWKGWGLPYEGGTEVDGIGFDSQGTSPHGLLQDAVRAESSALRGSVSTLIMADEYQPGNLNDTALKSSMQDLNSVGAFGVFLDSTDPDQINQFLKVGKTLSWTPGSKLHALYFPVSATNPAEPQRLGQATWWLPSPVDGNRLDFGNTVFGYRMQVNGDQNFVVWSPNSDPIESFDVINPKTVQVMSTDPDPVNLKLVKGGFQMRLPSLPIELNGLTEIPSPVSVYSQTIAESNDLTSFMETTHRVAVDPEVQYKDAVSSYAQSPGAALMLMRSAVRKLTSALGSFVWVNADNPATYSLGESIADPSGCNGSVWMVRSNLSIPGSSYTLDYTVANKVTTPVTIWLAAKIAPEDLSKVQCVIRNQSIRIKGPSQGNYGDGYGWYKLGTTGLEEQNDVKLIISGAEPFNMRFDAIVFTPTDFHPDGSKLPQTPEDLFSTIPKPTPVKKGR